jgi:hypothetical protein
MNSLDQAYHPPAELARLHIRNAVIHFLQHPPVQGKAALDRLLGEVESTYFPRDSKKALEFFKTGPLDHPRESLIRAFAIVLLKNTLSHSYPAREKCIVAFAAVRQMYRQATDEILEKELNALCSRVIDSKLFLLINLLSELPELWSFLRDDTKIRLSNAVTDGEDIFSHIHMTLDLDNLRELSLQRLASASEKQLAEAIAIASRKEFVDSAVALYCNASNWHHANTMGDELILPLCEYLDKNLALRLLRAAIDNGEVGYSHTWIRKIKPIIEEMGVSIVNDEEEPSE